ncbi:MAG: VOC family protein, partial [Pseudomonadota bacterium]
MSLEFLHAMVRVSDIDAALKFYGQGLGLKEVMRYDSEEGRF